MKSAKYIIVFVAFLIVPFLMFNSCKKDENVNDTTPQTTTDFRDGFVGDYSCMRVYNHQDTAHNWLHDTTYNNIINISISSNDNALIVVIPPNPAFEATYEGNNKFTCFTNSGPYDYVTFYDLDSIFGFKKVGVPYGAYYYGSKVP